MASDTAPSPWSGAHDIRLMADRLDARHFKALSSGLGIGDVRPSGISGARQPMRRPAQAPEQVPAGYAPYDPTLRPKSALRSIETAPSGLTTTMQRTPRVVFDPEFIPSLSRGDGAAAAGGWEDAAAAQGAQGAQSVARPGAHYRIPLSRTLLSWSLDFLFVASCAAVAVVAAAAATAWRAKGAGALTGAEGLANVTAWLELRPMKLIASAPAWAPLASIWGLYALYMGVFRLGVGFTVGDVLAGTRRARARAARGPHQT
jgi:hypothetical protein